MERRLLPPDGRELDDGRRVADREGSSTVPFEQIGHSAKKRLWRQKVGTGCPAYAAALRVARMRRITRAFSSGQLITPSGTASTRAWGRLSRTISIDPWNQAFPG